MKLQLCTLALAAVIGFAGPALAEDNMAAPMQGDAMAVDSMAMQGEAMMSPEDMLKACLDKAAMEADATRQNEATRACNEQTSMMAGDAMHTDGMAMQPDAMATDAMAPKQ